MDTISRALANYQNALQAARSLWMASDGVDRSEFNAFARSLDSPSAIPDSRGSAGARWSPTTKRRGLLRDGPLPGNPILTERTIPASLLLGALLWLLAQVDSLYREAGRLARTDSLTGVANRWAWDEELPRELARAARSGERLCLALVDLDRFKAYNDRHGHPAGNRLLREAAAAWEEPLRKTDLLARYGGEEFAVLLPNCGLGDAMEIAERLRTALPEGTCSIGVATWDRREEATALVARALYAAKEGGRNRSRADLAEAAEAAGRAQG